MLSFQARVLRRLTAAHRGAVRALQDLVNQFTEYDLRLGLPRAYTELCVLLRQLSLCCAQLEIAGESGVPEAVMHLLEDVAVGSLRALLTPHNSLTISWG